MLSRSSFFAADAVVSPMPATKLLQLSTRDMRISQAHSYRSAEGKATATIGAERAGFKICGRHLVQVQLYMC